MIDISPELLTVLMLAGVLAGVLIGYPLAIPVGAMGLLFGYLVYGNSIQNLLYGRVFNIVHSYTLLAIPLFVFMGVMLEKSGIAERLYQALYVWLSGLSGGLAIVTVLLGTILAACVGVIGASVSMLAIFALPAMLRRGYDKSLAAGAVCGGGTLGILIPPSIMLVIYGPMAGVSVGKLFMGAFIPGFILAALYCLYIGIRCGFNKKLGPPVPAEEVGVSFGQKSWMLFVALAPTAFIILAVLGSIFLGIAPPTEAAAVGALASVLLAVGYKRFNLQVLKQTVTQAMQVSSMIYLIGALSFAYVGVFIGAGCGDVIEEFILGAPGGRWGGFLAIMFIVFLLGFFIDWIGIVFIMVPIVAPIAPALGFDSLWFGMMLVINLQMSFMTPPFAAAIFYLRGSADPALGITMGDIINGVWPFVICIIIGLVLCVIFPELILWLPGKMIA